MFATLLVAHAVNSSAASSVSYAWFKHAGHGYHAVTANLGTGAISAGMTKSTGLASVWTHVKKDRPIAAITGTFFHMNTHRPVGDVLVDGNLLAKGFRGSAIGVDWFGGVKIFDTSFKEPVDWSLYRYGVRGVIRVLSKGLVCPNPKAQKFRDARLWGRAARTGIGVTAKGKLILMATRSSVTLSELGGALKSRGAVDAVSLDGGGSTCLYYRGSLVVPPLRKLSNMLVIFDHPPY